MLAQSESIEDQYRRQSRIVWSWNFFVSFEQDPSVQRATTRGGGAPVERPPTADLDDYNPFEGQKTVGQPANTGSGPAVMNAQSPQPQKPPPITTADFQVRTLSWLTEVGVVAGMNCESFYLSIWLHWS